MEAAGSARGSWRCSLLVSVVLLNICIPSLVLSYGVLLYHQVSLDLPVWLGLSTPTIFILTYSLTQCWCREAADSWGGPVGFRVMSALGLATVAFSLLLCAFTPIHLHPLIYGVLCGFGSSLISAQVDAVIFDSYDSQVGVVRGLCFAGQAVGQALFPHLLILLIHRYGYHHSYILLSAIMLQTLPAIMCLRVDDTIRRPVSFTRYSDLAKTYAIYNNEGIDNNYYTAELQLHDMTKKCWKSPSDDNLHTEGEGNEVTDQRDEGVSTITPPPSPEEKRRNIYGVEILPEIPEESEEEEEEYFNTTNNKKHRVSVAIKRLSTLGDNLDDCISNQSRRDSQCDNVHEIRDYTEVEVTYDNVSPVTDVHREKIFNSFSFRCRSAYTSLRRRLWMPSYKVYRLRRRTLYLMYNINDIFVKPLTRSLSLWTFYPSLCLAFVKLSLTAIPQASLHLIATKMQPNISTVESNFLMTLYAFTWICFLLCTPWLIQTPKRNYKYIALIGLIISTAACFVLAESNNHDMFSIGIVIAGFGYGAISTCWETAVQDLVGPRKWPKVHSTLETLSGCCLACFMLGISFIVDQEGGLQFALRIQAVTLSAIACVWTVIVAVSVYDSQVRSSTWGRLWLLR